MTTDVRQQLIHYLKKQLSASPYIGLYHLADWNIHLDTWPELRDDVEAYKSKYIKSMLTAFKEDNYGHVESTLSRLQDIGVKWPELDVIRNSYDTMTRSWPNDDELMEADAARSEYLDGLVDLASNGLWLDFQHMLISTYHNPNDLPQNLKERLHGQLRRMFLTDFEDAARRFVSQKLVSRYDLLPYLAVTAADIAPIVNKYKDGLITHILKNMKNSTNITYWGSVAAYLYDMGAAWPELKVIYRSVKSEVEAQNRPQQIDEADSLSAGDKHRIERWIDEFTIGFRTKNQSKIEYTLFSVLVPNHDRPLVLAEISQSLAVKLKPEVLEYLHRELAVEDRRKVLENMPNVLNVLTLITPSEWPEVPAILDQYKDRFMQYYLSFFKLGSVTQFLSDDEFDTLHKFAVNWPELKTLERSYNLEKKSVRNINESTKRSAEETIADYHNVPLLMVRVLGERGYTVANPAVADVMEKVKPYLIQKILKMFDDESYASIPYNVSVIKRVGVNWPEFDVILKSAKAEYDKNSNDWYLNEGEMKIHRERTLTQDDYSKIRQISALLYKGAVADALWVSFELPSRTDDLTHLLEHYKDTIMKFLLKEIQKGTGVYLLEIVLDGLNRQLIAWPELAIVKRTVYSDEYKGIE